MSIYSVFRNKRFGLRQEIQYIKNYGLCCWKIYPKKHYRGLPQLIEVGYDESFNSHVGSIKRVECPYQK